MAATPMQEAAQYLARRGYQQASELLSGSSRPHEIEVKDLLRDELASGPSYRRKDLRLGLHIHPDEDGAGYVESFKQFENWLAASSEWLQRELQDFRFPLLLHCFIGLASRGDLEHARMFLKARRRRSVQWVVPFNPGRLGLPPPRPTTPLTHRILLSRPQGFIPSLSTDAQRATAANLAQIDQASQLQNHDVARRYLVHRSMLFCSPAAWESLCEFLVASRLLLLLLLLFKFFDVRAIATQPPRERQHAAAPTAGAPAKMATSSSGGKAMPPPPRTLAAPPSICLVTQNSSHADLCCCDVSPSGSYVALGRSDGAIQLCRLSRAEALQSRFGAEPADLPSRSREVHGHSGPVYSVATSFDQQHVLSGSSDGSVRLWSWHHAACLAAYANHSYPVWHVAFASHHAQFLSSCYDGGLRLFDTQRLTPLRLMAGHLSDVTAARFHPSDAYAVSASHDGTLRLWDVSSSGCVRLLLGHTGPVTDVAIAPRAEVAASASLDETVRLWDLGSGRARASLPHGEPVSQVAFSSDGQLLASIGARRVRIWHWEAAASAGAGAEPLLSCDSPVMLLGAAFMTGSPLLLACGLGEDPILSVLT